MHNWEKWIKMLSKSIIPVVLICFTSCGADKASEADKAKSKSPEILRAVYDSGTSSSSLSFKQDSTFEWFSGSALGASDEYQGKYNMQDSIIELDRIGFSRVIKSKRLLLAKKHLMPRGVDGDYLFQVDENNKLVDSIFIFTIEKRTDAL
jgi:hypothetical protein